MIGWSGMAWKDTNWKFQLNLQPSNHLNSVCTAIILLKENKRDFIISATIPHDCCRWLPFPCTLLIHKTIHQKCWNRVIILTRKTRKSVTDQEAGHTIEHILMIRLFQIIFKDKRVVSELFGSNTCKTNWHATLLQIMIGSKWIQL